MNRLKQNYENSVNEYIIEFYRRTKLKLSYWIDEFKIGEFNDYYLFSFDDIRYFIDNDLEENTLLNWHELPSKISLNHYYKLEHEYKYKKGFSFNHNDFNKHLNEILNNGKKEETTN